jgi:hypothetical protein
MMLVMVSSLLLLITTVICGKAWTAFATPPGVKPDTQLCLDGDAADETYWVGYVDGINDFHHIKRYGITAFFDPQAETDYHKGYQAGWATASMNGTTIDRGCWDTRIGN